MDPQIKKLIQKKVDQMKVSEEKDARTILGEDIWEKIQKPKAFGREFKKAVEEGEIENLKHMDELPNSGRHDIYRRIKKTRKSKGIPVIIKRIYNSNKIEIGVMIYSITGRKETKQTKKKMEEYLLGNILNYIYPGKRYSCFRETNDDSAAIVVLIEDDTDTEESTVKVIV